MFNNHSIQMHDQVNKNTLSLVILFVQGSRNLTALANNMHQTNEIFFSLILLYMEYWSFQSALIMYYGNTVLT